MADETTDTTPDPEAPADAAPPTRAFARLLSREELAKLNKGDLLDAAVEATNFARDLADTLDNDRSRSRAHRDVVPTPFTIMALLDLHRTVGAAQGSTIRGRKPDGTAPRYLDAARVLGDELVADILG